MLNRHRCLVVGAGFCCAVAARKSVTRTDSRVLVIDERPHVVGNCHTSHEERTEVMVHHYGPHIFNTDDGQVWKYILKGIFGWGLWAHGRNRTMLAPISIAAAASLGLNFILIPTAGIFGAVTACFISALLLLIGTNRYSDRTLRITVPAPLEAVAI